MRHRDITAALAVDLSGNGQCGDRDCRRRDAIACEYLDDQLTPCASSWCSNHLAVIDGSAYCLRHAGTVRALQGSALRPSVTNRCPSLVYWVARQLDIGVRGLLEDVRDHGGETIIATPVRAIRDHRATDWRTEWTLRALDTTLSIAVSVAEVAPTVVVISLDGEQLISQEPPWITLRASGQEAADPQLRLVFAQDLLTAIRNAVLLRRSQ